MDLEIIFVGVLFLLIGLINVFKPEWYIRFAQWQTRVIWRAEFNPSRYTESRMRILGALFLLIAAYILYNHLVLGNI